MVKKEIIWSPTATESFDNIIEYLKINRPEKDLFKLVEKTENVIDYISAYPLMFRKTTIIDVHEALITEHNLLIYKIYSNHIVLITFWDTRQNPNNKPV